MAYEVGYRVRCLANRNEGKEGTIIDVTSGPLEVYVTYDDGSYGSSRKPEKYYQIISTNRTHKVVEQKMSLIAKLMLSLKSEPEKSFIKAGITVPSGEFTSEGKELFINWLAQDKDTMAKFNEQVVQPLLEQMKEDKDCGK